MPRPHRPNPYNGPRVRTEDVRWTPYGGVAADGQVPEMAARLVREWKAGLITDHGHTRTGDALVVWSAEDGVLTLTWCLVRHEAEVPRG